jgi:hypothetical protein
MAHDREVGGIRCLHVLEHLADYLEGDVSDELRERIEAHLRECDWCERFGGGYTSTVSSLRKTLCDPDPLDEDIKDRLAHRLSQLLSDDE